MRTSQFGLIQAMHNTNTTTIVILTIWAIIWFDVNNVFLVTANVITTTTNIRTANAQKHRKVVEKEDGIDGEYIVIFKNNNGLDINEKAKSIQYKLTEVIQENDIENYPEIDSTFDEAQLKGLTIKNIKNRNFIHQIADDDDDIMFIEQDQPVKADFFLDLLWPNNDNEEKSADAKAAQIPWGLDRINQISRPLDNNGYHNYTGIGVDVYVMDSGIRETHVEFGETSSRAYCSFNVFSNSNDTCIDGTGHGTHVSSVIGGVYYGVAKDVTIYSVKVLDYDGNGKVSGVIAGINHIIEQKQITNRPSIANLSLGGGISDAMNIAIEAAVDAGIVFVVSAGNNMKSACDQSPAMSDVAITVGATNQWDFPALYTNYGSCVNIFSPGTDIEGAWNTGDSATKSLTGTSMATPFVTGVAALYLERNPSLSPSQLWDEMKADAVMDQITFLILHRLVNSPNILLHTPIE